MVDFTLTDEQKALREMAHDFAEKEIRPKAWEYDKDGGDRGISAFVVQRDAGVVVDKHEDKMGQRASNTATISFNDVEIPADHLIGEENKGFKIAMMTLDRTRPGVAAMATGIARAAFEFATNYSKERVQFGVPIAMHQAIQFMIADMATKVHLARL